MLGSFQPPAQTSNTSHEQNRDAHVRSTSLAVEPSVPPNKINDVRHDIFSRPGATSTRDSSAPALQSERRMKIPLSNSHSNHRLALHNVLTSGFHRTPSAGLPRPTSPDPISVPSIEVVSPRAFNFSGPSLRSRSESFSDSTSRLTSSTEMAGDFHSLHHAHSDAKSMDEVRVLEGRVLEPCDDGLVRSMSDVLLGTDIHREETGVHILGAVQEEGQNLRGKGPVRISRRGCYSDAVFAPFVMPFLDSASRKVLRDTSRSWRAAFDPIRHPLQPAFHHMPVELIQQVYGYLGPKDFNAARHTCRNWMRASLYQKILVTMLRRGGWWTSCQADLESRKNPLFRGKTQYLTSEEWFLSRRLSRECALSANWTGNGLNDVKVDSVFAQVSEVDFTNLTNGHCGSSHRRHSGLVFNTSTCGQFLLVGKDTLIYVYQIQGTTLVPATTVVCPRRVLSMSMDASFGNESVAALLEGRMGMFCELHFGRATENEDLVQAHVNFKGHTCQTIPKGFTFPSPKNGIKTMLDSADNCPRQLFPNDRDRTPFDSVNVQSNYEAISLDNVNDYRTHLENNINQTWNLRLRGARSRCPPEDNDADHAKDCVGSIPIESGTSTFYRHLCSEDDPPRSVLICPQRSGVLFGCAAGVELHWIDPHTGQSLNRWFPLTAPSDYIHFLDPQPGFESARELRLISSAAHPDHHPALSRRFLVGRPTISSFLSAFGFGTTTRHSLSPACEQYHVVPLSDGHHVLFIDPITSKLVMGYEAPPNGPTKLVQKTLFIPPSSVQDRPPRFFAAAPDIHSGVRIAVAFDSTIVFYNVPADILAVSHIEQQEQLPKPQGRLPYWPPPCRTTDHWRSWWDGLPFSSRWGYGCVPLRGTVLGELKHVCELAVSTTPDITIWAYSLDAKCRVWQVRNFAEPALCERRYVCPAGIVHDAYAMDEDRDVVMADGDDPPAASRLSSPPDSLRLDSDDGKPYHTDSFDGLVSQSISSLETPSHGLRVESEGGGAKRLPGALSVENDDWVGFLDVRCCEAWYEENGDVVVVPRARGWGAAWEVEDGGGAGGLEALWDASEAQGE